MDTKALRNWATHELALQVSRDVVSTLEKGGVKALPVKGLVLARQVYQPEERPISDVDMILSPSDFARAVDLARAAGWGLVWDSKLVGAVNFVVERIAIDIKSSFGPPGMSAVSVASVFARATRSRQPLDFDHWLIELHDHALLLAIDAFKDKLGAGRPWARSDLVRIAASSGFSPRELVDRAGEAELHTMLSIVADWVCSSAHTAEWSAVREHLRSRPIRGSYVARHARALATASGSRWRSWYLAALTRAVSDSARQRALALALSATGTAQFVARHGALRVDPWQATEE